MKKIYIGIIFVVLFFGVANFSYADELKYEEIENEDLQLQEINDIDEFEKNDIDEKKIDVNSEIQVEKIPEKSEKILQEEVNEKIDNESKSEESDCENNLDIDQTKEVVCNSEEIENEKIGNIDSDFIMKKSYSVSDIEKEETNIQNKVIEDGEYEIRTSINNNLVLDIQSASTQNEAKLQIWDDIDETQQRFFISYLGDGYYKITVDKSNKVIDVKNAGKSEGTMVQQYDSNNSDAQKWRIESVGEGLYCFISKCNELCMSIEKDGNISRDLKIVMKKYNNSASQKFLLEKVSDLESYRPLEDGEYEIRSSTKENLIFDIQCASMQNEAKLQIWDDIDETQQRFALKYIGDGYYTIAVKKSNKLLDVQWAGTKEGTSVQQYSVNNSDAQKWRIKDLGDGSYNIISKCNGLYMTINKNVNRDSKIVMNKKDSTNYQKFIFDKVVKDKAFQTLEDGEYEIRTSINDNLILDIQSASIQNEAKLQIWDDLDESQQRFYITHMGNGLYKISVRKSGKMIDVQGGNLQEKTAVQQYTNNNLDAQRWIIKDLGDGYFSIISARSGYYMTITNTKRDSKIILEKNNNSDMQKFKFDKVIKEKAVRTIENGEYEIRSLLNDNLIFDIQNASVQNGARLQLWDDINETQQRFLITYVGDGYYKITIKKSNKALDVKDGSLKDRAVVQQYSDNNSDAQRWIIKDLEDGYFSIISVCNGMTMTADGNGREAKFILTENTYSDRQKFKFEKITQKVGIDVSLYQGTIDWAAVKDSGVDFAMIRVGYRGYGSGKMVLDSKFVYNIENALKNDIECGVYFYSQAINEHEAIEEAEFVVNAIKKYDISYPVAFDSEYSSDARTGRADYLSVKDRTSVCKSFCEKISQNGYAAMVYASKYWFYDNLNVNELREYETWVAHYVNDVSNKTDYKYDYFMWQYTSTGKVNGIKGNVDMNIRPC